MENEQKSNAKVALVVFIIVFLSVFVLINALQTKNTNDTPAIPPLRPIPTIPDYDRDAVQPGRPDDIDKQFQGWVPDPEGTREFLRELGNRAQLLQAGPDLIVRDNEPTYLYRALYKAYESYRPGQKWIVGRQGIGDCFVKGTLVTMFDGTSKPIESILLGDCVISHIGAIRKVENIFERSYTGQLVTIRAEHSEKAVTATVEHKFVTQAGWKAIGQLTTSDFVYLPDKEQWSVLASIQRKYVVNEPVYDITVAEDHSFIANGYGVHNCVSWAFGHGADIHLAVMYTLGDTAEWKPAATEAIYGGSRVEARGRKTGGYVDGSYGGAAARWLVNWGALFRLPYQTPNGLIDLTQYSASRAKDWGNYGCGGKDDNGYLDAQAKRHPIRDVTLVKTFREAAAAIQSGYPVAVCSNQGFSKTRDEQGFARPVGSWAHAMCFIGVRFDRPGLLCLNSWSNWNSGPKYPADMPDGSFWVDAKVCDSMLGRGDSFAISGYDGFPYRELRHDQWVLNIRYVDHLYAIAP